MRHRGSAGQLLVEEGDADHRSLGHERCSLWKTTGVKALIAEVADQFKHSTSTDPDTGKSLPYNLFLPAHYDPSKSYPLVLYIADASLVGRDVAATLSQCGAPIWASSAEQDKHESIALVPEYPEVISDDHGSYRTTQGVEITARLLQNVEHIYGVDTDRVYGTGHSMGCMTVMYLAAQDPQLFAASRTQARPGTPPGRPTRWPRPRRSSRGTTPPTVMPGWVRQTLGRVRRPQRG